MSDSAERKIKLLLLYEILLKQTGELPPMTTSEIFTALQESGIAVSRQTIEDGLFVLRYAVTEVRKAVRGNLRVSHQSRKSNVPTPSRNRRFPFRTDRGR